MKKSTKKTRVTLDLTPQFYERLEKLEELVGAQSKANVIRQALQLYEFIAIRSLRGDRFKAIPKTGEEEAVVFFGLQSDS